jgi:uncharacterized protein (DUF1800 family)
MRVTPSPLTERMTLFWHGHFATSAAEGPLGPLMYRQNVLLRREALGNFARLLHAIARDPAMLVYLDNAGSRSEAPNENFAREVMELFTLGEGHYGERDVKEARARFTGWSLDRDTRRVRLPARVARLGEKTVLGRTGRLDGDGGARLAARAAETAESRHGEAVARVRLAHARPRRGARLGRLFRDARYEVKPLLRALFSRRRSGAEQPRAPDQVARRPGGRAPTHVRHPAAGLRRRRSPSRRSARTLLAAQREGLARGRGLDQPRTLLAAASGIDRVFRGARPR